LSFLRRHSSNKFNFVFVIAINQKSFLKVFCNWFSYLFLQLSNYVHFVLTTKINTYRRFLISYLLLHVKKTIYLFKFILRIWIFARVFFTLMYNDTINNIWRREQYEELKVSSFSYTYINLFHTHILQI
jgi:hypothetical protein